MKILLMGDRHNTDKTPLARIDDFQAAIEAKDLEILKIARENDCRAIIQAGDFWDEVHKKLPNEYIQTILKRWFGEQLRLSSKLSDISLLTKEEILDVVEATKGCIPMLGVAGNHDLIGSSLASLPATTAGLVDFMGLIKLVTKENPIILKDASGFSVAITGTPYYSDIDRPENIGDYIVDKKLADFHIHVIHGALTDKRPRGMTKYTLIDSIKSTQADVTLCGHMHTGFETVEFDGKYIINPGAVIRMSATKSEMTRQIHVVLLDITKDGVKVSEIPLKSARPGHEVLSKDHIIKANEKLGLAELYDSKVNSYGIRGSTTIDDVFKEIMDNEHVDEEKKNNLKKRLDARRAQILTKITPVDNAWIESIHLENFQSHKDTLIPLTNGFNVLLGKSNQGKTAVLRALTWVYKNKPSGAGTIVRNGCNWCRVTVKLGNGTIVSRYIETKGVVSRTDNDVSKNIYQIIYADGTIKEGNTKLLPEVQRALGYCDFTYDEKKSLDTNFMRQKDSWYLIGDGYSGSDRAKIIGALMETNAVDANIKECEGVIRNINQSIQIEENSIKNLDEEMGQFFDLDDQKKAIDEITALLSKADVLNQKIVSLTKIRDEIRNINSQMAEEKAIIEEIKKNDYNISLQILLGKYSSLQRMLDLYQRVTQTISAIKEAEGTIRELGDLSSLNSDVIKAVESLQRTKNLILIQGQIKEVKKQQSENQDLLSHEKLIVESVNGVSTLSEKLKVLGTVCDIQRKISEESKYTRTDTLIISTFPNMGELENLLSEASTSLKNLVLVNEMMKKINDNIRMQNGLKDEIQATEKRVCELESEYQAVLEKIGVCPTCGKTTTGG